MSIKSDIQELEAIKHELKTLTIRRKALKEKEKAVETRITDYLRANEHPGVKHQGKAIMLQPTEKRITKKPKDRDMDAASVLRNYGIENPEKVLVELMEARKGEKTTLNKLKIQKI
jgi:hypothetical protein